MINIKNKLKVIIIILILVLGFFIIKKYDLYHVSPEKIKQFILSFGWKGPFLYILLNTIRPVFLFPISILTLAGGLAFGPVYGAIYELIGATMGACVSFFIAERLGQATVQKWLGDKFKKIDYQLESNGLKSIAFLRLIPIFNFDAISYAAGVSKVKFRDFTLGTLIGMIPGSIVFNILGDALNHPFTKKFYLALIYMVLLTVIPIAYIYIKKNFTRKSA